MNNKQILAFFVLGIMMVFLAACSKPEAAPAVPQPAPEVQKEVPQESAPAEAPKEIAMPSQIDDVGEQLNTVDQTASEINTADLADVEGALADVENI